MPILVTKKQNTDAVSYWKIPDMEAAIFPKMQNPQKQKQANSFEKAEI